MKKYEESEPLQQAEIIKYKQARFEINKLQQEIEMHKVDRDYM